MSFVVIPVPSTAPIAKSTAKEADVVSENESALTSSTKPSQPEINNGFSDDRVLKEFEFSSISSLEYSEIASRLTSVAFAAIGANKPKAAGATNKRWKSFINCPHTIRVILK